MNELDALIEQAFEEFLLDVSPVGEDLPIQDLCKHRPYPAVPVIHICSCKTERYHFAGIIAEQVQLESMAPAHGALSVLGKAGKDLVVISSYIVVYGYHGAVNVGDSGTLAKSIELHEQHHLKEHSWHELDEAVIGNRVGKILPHRPFAPIQIILLEIAIRAEMIAYQNGHNLTFGEPALAVPVAFAVTVMGRQTQVFRKFGTQILVKLVDYTENFSNFVVGNHRSKVL